MKTLLPFVLLTLLVTACSQEGDEDGSSLLDMFDNEGGVEEEGETAADAAVEEEPYSIGPSEIPDDLVLPE